MVFLLCQNDYGTRIQKGVLILSNKMYKREIEEKTKEYINKEIEKINETFMFN